MNVNIVRLGGITKLLGKIEMQLGRIADAMELDLATQGIHVKAPVADTSGPEPTAGYHDDELDWALENVPDFERLYKESLTKDVQ